MIQESDQDNFRSCLRNFLSGARKKNIKDMSKPKPRFSCEQSPIQFKICFLIYIGIFSRERIWNFIPTHGVWLPTISSYETGLESTRLILES